MIKHAKNHINLIKRPTKKEINKIKRLETKDEVRKYNEKLKVSVEIKRLK